ncbi:H-2 class II histocompatibility antigen, E-S beta chain-like [Varanus komodoensis]|uniref:H-2 class II histocompatibility antigen, E-S beta chain-like n=1 Tax=Varanus komodoensis TaxID=61221 RepID=UPI001CF7AB68|nr:H-2 class II histocompatibility antigen, E-S beta chain-like [Varanus komodoensis]
MAEREPKSNNASEMAPHAASRNKMDPPGEPPKPISFVGAKPGSLYPETEEKVSLLGLRQCFPSSTCGAAAAMGPDWILPVTLVLLLGPPLVSGGGGRQESPASRRFLAQDKFECRFSNATGREQVRLLYRYIYDRTEIARFDSALGRYEALTVLGEPAAEYWNSQEEVLAVKRREVDSFCRYNYEKIYGPFAHGRRVKPVVTVSPTKDDPLSPRTLLLCTAASFYPREIKIHWLKNGRRATEGVLYGEELHNGDWTYQIQVMLEDTPQRGDVYACQVEHASLKTPLIVRWERRTSASARSKVWTGVTGALLGMVYLAVGLSLYLRSKKASPVQQPAALIG